MAAWDTLFPLEVSSFGAAPRYMTEVIAGRNGQEVRNALWQDPLLSFNAAFTVKTYEDILTLTSFFHVMRGREQSFLLKDESDYQIARQTIGTGNGVLTAFQLKKTYTDSVATDYDRNIYHPKQLEGVGGVRVWVNNSELAASAYSFTTGAAGGVITISSPSPVPDTHVVEASCDEFYVPVRFDVDELPVQLLTHWIESGADFANVNVPDIAMIEVRGE